MSLPEILLDPRSSRQLVWRIGITGAALAAFVFAYHDVLIPLGAKQLVHPYSSVVYAMHYRIEAIVRICMVLAAILTAWTTRGLQRDRLLATALIGSSLDVYWQWYDPTAPRLWLPMLLKYAGTSYGLMQFIRFASRFSDEQLHGIPKALYRLAPVVFLIGACGFAAQFLKLPPDLNPLAQYYGYDPTRMNTRVLFNTYIIGDAVAKLVMITAAGIGFVTAPKGSRQRMLLVFVSFCGYAFGTAAHFLLRLHFTSDPDWLNDLDAGFSLALPFGLGAALLNKHFFDVEFYLDRALTATVASGALLLAYFGVEHVTGETARQWIASAVPVLGRIGVPPDAVAPLLDFLLLFAVFFIVHRLYVICEPLVERLFSSDRDKRMEALREFRDTVANSADVTTLKKGLHHALDFGADATFAHVYQLDADALGAERFDPVICYPECPTPVAGNDVAIAMLRQTRKPVKLYHHDSTALPGELALPMPVGGKLFGFLACGPNRSRVRYAPDQIEELAAIARETGATLFALQAHAARPAPV